MAAHLNPWARGGGCRVVLLNLWAVTPKGSRIRYFHYDSLQ